MHNCSSSLSIHRSLSLWPMDDDHERKEKETKRPRRGVLKVLWQEHFTRRLKVLWQEHFNASLSLSVSSVWPVDVDHERDEEHAGEGKVFWRLKHFCGAWWNGCMQRGERPKSREQI